MRPRLKTAAVLAVGLVAVLAGGSAALLAQDKKDEDDPPATSDSQKVAQEALDKAIARGRAMWSDSALFPKTCAKCHDEGKPPMQMKNRKFSYPAYSKRSKNVVTLQQKIQEMIKFNSKGTPLDHAGTDIAALEAYIQSCRK